MFLIIKRGTEIVSAHDCFGVAPHSFELKSKTLTSSELKSPVAKDMISIEYIVGGGGGHQLHVEDFKMIVTRGASYPQ